MLKEILKNYGLSEKEAKIYLAALRLNEATAQELSKKSGIHRSTVYVIVKSLQEKGLLLFTKKGKKKYFVPARPDKITEFLRSRKNIIDSQLNAVQGALPELMSIYNYSVNKPRIRYFEGLEGLKEIYRDTLLVKKTIYAFTPVYPQISKKLMEWLNNNYVQERVKLGIKAQVISPSFSSQLTKEFFKESSKYLRELKIISARDFPLRVEVQIYGPKIALVSYATKEMFGVIIESEESSQTWKAIFDLAWKGASLG